MKGFSEDVGSHIVGLTVDKRDLLIVAKNLCEPIDINAVSAIDMSKGRVPTVFDDLDSGLVVLFEQKGNIAAQDLSPQVEGGEAFRSNG